MNNEAKHSIKTYLLNNPLTPDPDDYRARVRSERSLSVDDICQTAATRGNSDIPPETMAYAVRTFLREMAYQLCDGYSVNADGWFTAAPVVRGVFHAPNEPFDRSRHAIRCYFAQGASMRREMAEVEVEVVGTSVTGPEIHSVEDRTGLPLRHLHPGTDLTVRGRKIKIVGDKPGVGVAFRNIDTDALTTVPFTDLIINHPTRLILLIPALPKGRYRLEVTTQYTNGRLVKAPRAGSFKQVLEVL